jgi:hypothetical protein
MAAVVTFGLVTRARRDAVGGASVFVVVLPELSELRLGCCARTNPGRNAKRISATSAGENLFFTETSLIVYRSEIKTGEPPATQPGDLLIGILTDAQDVSKVAPEGFWTLDFGLRPLVAKLQRSPLEKDQRPKNKDPLYAECISAVRMAAADCQR